MDIRPYVDPEVAAVLAALPMDSRGLRLEHIPARRAQMAANAPAASAPRPGVERTERVVGGTPDIRIRVYRPLEGAGPWPCLLWMHGGGFVFGSYAMDDALLEGWCERLECVVVSVDYRLAPEHAYPSAIEDCHQALAWIDEHASNLEVDPERIGVGGGSAGGCLAAGLTLMARDRGMVRPAFQLLLSPTLDDRIDTESIRWTAFPWAPDAALVWQAYLGRAFGDEVPAYAAPARARDLSELPPTFLSVGSLDGFLDEGLAYASRLAHAKVPVELHVFPSVPHGYEVFARDAVVSQRAHQALATWLRDVVKQPRK